MANISTILDKFDLYELCAQSPDYDARLLSAIHGGEPRTLGEDFCGTAAISRAWVQRSRTARAVVVDHDRETLELAMLARPPRTTFLLGDVMAAKDKADIISVQNFSICEIHTRRALVRYLRHARSRLKRRGVFVCDIYSGSDAYLTGMVEQKFTGPDGEKIAYFWEQRTANPLTGRVVDAMHFDVRRGRSREQLHDAFVYDWRLWSIPELREAMMEAGFKSTHVFPRMAGAKDQTGELHVLEIESPEEIGDSFACLVAART